MRDANRPHLERRAQGALAYIANVLRQARIRAKARVQLGQNGRGRIVVAVQGMGVTEAELLLPSSFGPFFIVVI